VHVTDLVEWLETAIGEAERVALAASYWPDDPECADWPNAFQHSSWRRQFIDEREMSNGVITDEGARRHSVAVVQAIGDSQMPVYLSRHIALNDPDAVLRRCAADRKLIAEVRRAEWTSKNTGDPAAVAVEIGLRSALKIVAEGYGYQEASQQ
jgi:hypothetical protein